MRPKRKKGPHSTSWKKFGKILKIRKNTLENSEKYFGKFGKILQKIRKNTLENSEKYFKKSGSRTQNHFFQLCPKRTFAISLNLKWSPSPHKWKKCFCLQEPDFRDRIFLICMRIFLILRRNFPNELS